MTIQRIGVLTSGGDAPGMNAALRAIVRFAIQHGVEVAGIRRGYDGLQTGDIAVMDMGSVSGILHRGGTALKSSRCLGFKTDEGRRKAIDTLERERIDALITIGGNGTTSGADALSLVWDKPIIGVPQPLITTCMAPTLPSASTPL